MGDYVRPEVPEVVYRGADGEPIDYGHRWGMDGPPTDSYSRTSNPDRFEPIVTVAESLIDWVHATFDVDVGRRSSDGADRDVVTITPRQVDTLPIVVTFTDFPGVTVTVGDNEPAPFPVCGCDACDDDIDAELDRLETLVFSVVDEWPRRQAE